LPALRVGPLEVGFPVVQAALSGYSDWPMRLIARRQGASYAICEVMLDQFLVTIKDHRKRNQHFLRLSDEERPVGGQLMGAEPEQFAAGARKLVDAGFDVIDINFGCPVKKVLGRCRGGYHLSQPEVALEIVRRTRDAVPSQIPVTVKMRRGIDDSAESRDKFFAILDGAFATGIAAVTVHGRTVQQRYIGPSRWQFLTEVKRHAGPERTILGSGDLFSAADCLAMLEQTGVDGITVARGAIGNPWIFAQARALAAGRPLPPPSLWEQRDIMLEHFRLAEELYGPERAGPQMRKFGIKYAASHPQHLIVREAFTRVRSLEDWRAVLAQWYADDLPGCYPDPALHRVGDCEEAA
jgi:nifR3 family TIM-barrel protein